MRPVMAELKTGTKRECDTDVGWELVREWTEGEGVRLKKKRSDRNEKSCLLEHHPHL